MTAESYAFSCFCFFHNYSLMSSYEIIKRKGIGKLWIYLELLLLEQPEKWEGK